MIAPRLPLALCLSLAFACESEPKKSAEPAEKKADAPEKEAAPEKHFDVSRDESGVLARSAAVLDLEEGVDTSDALHDLSHHAEKLPSVQALCKKMKALGSVDDEKTCVTQSEHHVVLIGPEIYAEWAACVMASNTADDVKICDEAEAEAEKLLHEKPHGDGLSKDDCSQLFDTFEKLAMADAGDQAELVKGVLEEVKDDVIDSCMEQGTKSELECAKTSKTLQELDSCASTHI